MPVGNDFVPNSLLIRTASSSCGDYHNEMNGPDFEKWITEKLLSNLAEKSITVMDNASYILCIPKNVIHLTRTRLISKPG